VILVNSPLGEGSLTQFLYTVVSDTYTAHIVEEPPPIDPD
jgi:hypothetical protein